MRQGLTINSEMLKWSIQRAGWTLDDFISMFPKYKKWIEGEKYPSVRQLETFSEKVHIPFGFLFLQSPPIEKNPIAFFRTDKNSETALSPNTRDMILLLQKRQDWLRNYLIESHNDPLKYVGQFKDSEDVIQIVNSIRDTLGLTKNISSQFKNSEEFYKYLIHKIEEIGIVLIFSGIYENNTHRSIPLKDCRGFVLVDEYAPFLFINNNDSKSSQIFTLLHELAHIWLGTTAGFDFEKMLPADDPIEMICDKVAAEFLVPAEEFLKVWNNFPIQKIVKYFKMSEIIIMRRAFDFGKLSKVDFYSFYDRYALKQSKRKKGSGGDFYSTNRKRLGKQYLNHIMNALKEGKLLYRDACKLTSLKGDTFQTLNTLGLFRELNENF